MGPLLRDGGPPLTVAFGQGFAGGFADGAVVEPEPVPVIIGSGGASPWHRTRWISSRPFAPQPPVRIRAAVHVGYRWSATVTTIHPHVRLTQPPPRLTARPASLTMWVRTRTVPPVATCKVAYVEGGRALSQFAYETRELAEIALVLAAWK